MITQKTKSVSRLFRTRPSLELHACLWLLVAWCLWAADAKYELRYAREGLSLLTHPLEQAVDWPMVRISWVLDSFNYNQSLIAENKKLRNDIIRLQNAIQQMQAVQKENEQLHALLRSSPQLGKNSPMMAQLLAVRSSALSMRLVINQGQLQNVKMGQVVMDAFGIIGQVIDVNLNSSIVMPITDQKSAVSIQSMRNGLRGIAIGLGSGELLSLINVPSHADVEPGDLFVTSGLGERYSYGYPVGKVIEVNRDQGHGFAKITLRVSAKLNRSRLVLLLREESVV